MMYIKEEMKSHSRTQGTKWDYDNTRYVRTTYDNAVQ